MKILYIGKHDVLIEKLKFYLPEMIIEHCDEFWEGIELAQTGIYCVVIINICGCLEWSLGLVRLRKNSDIPIAILTGSYKLDEKMTAFGFGVNDYMTDINDIIALSSMVVKYKHALSEIENARKGDAIKEFIIDIGGEKLYHNGEYVRLPPKNLICFICCLAIREIFCLMRS